MRANTSPPNQSIKRRKKRNNRQSGYTEEQKRMVLERYPYCITREEKMELAGNLGMTSLEQLYNLANRLGATRQAQNQDDSSRRAHTAFSPERRLLREDPDEINWSDEDDKYIRDRFGKMHIEEIAFHRNHTEAAIMHRARQLGARNYCKYWPQDHVTAWLSQPLEILIEMGMDSYPCRDLDGKVSISLVSSSSLLRMIANNVQLALLEASGADRFFLQELKDLLDDHRKDRVLWEASRWVSHGHICLNPWSREAFLMFDDGTSSKISGRQAYPSDLMYARSSD